MDPQISSSNGFDEESFQIDPSLDPTKSESKFGYPSYFDLVLKDDRDFDFGGNVPVVNSPASDSVEEDEGDEEFDDDEEDNRRQTRQMNNYTRESRKSSSKDSEGGVKGRPRYKHIPHRDKPVKVVEKRNERERRRVQTVNSAFLKLRKYIPYENRHKRLSKVKTLRKAIEYISNLQQVIRQYDARPLETTSQVISQTQQHHHPHHPGLILRDSTTEQCRKMHPACSDAALTQQVVHSTCSDTALAQTMPMHPIYSDTALAQSVSMHPVCSDAALTEIAPNMTVSSLTATSSQDQGYFSKNLDMVHSLPVTDSPRYTPDDVFRQSPSGCLPRLPHAPSLTS